MGIFKTQPDKSPRDPELERQMEERRIESEAEKKTPRRKEKREEMAFVLVEAIDRLAPLHFSKNTI